MDATSRKYEETELTGKVIGAFYETYNALGHGFLESVYENALALQLLADGIPFRRQAELAVRFREQVVGIFRADFLVADKLVIELKAVDRLMPAHESQLLNYLKATGIKLGLLLNFGPKAEIRRRVF